MCMMGRLHHNLKSTCTIYSTGWVHFHNPYVTQITLLNCYLDSLDMLETQSQIGQLPTFSVRMKFKATASLTDAAVRGFYDDAKNLLTLGFQSLKTPGKSYVSCFLYEQGKFVIIEQDLQPRRHINCLLYAHLIRWTYLQHTAHNAIITIIQFFSPFQNSYIYSMRRIMLKCRAYKSAEVCFGIT